MEGISKLPQEIIHHILSFLDVQEAARTSVLSKGWLHAWQTRPILHCSVLYFPRTEKFVNYLHSSLMRYQEKKISIETFKLISRRDLNWCGDYYWTPRLNIWIGIALEIGVKKLELVVSDAYSLSPIVFKAKFLEDLSVYHGRLQVPEKISCFRLKRLCLSKLCLDEVTLQNILSSCHYIEFLNLDHVKGIENLKVVSSRNLKELHVYFCRCETIEVEAPNLELFLCIFCHGPRDNSCRLNLKTSQNLKFLELFHIDIDDMFFHDFNYKFPKLEDLLIQNCPRLRCLKISSQSLKNLNLVPNQGLKELWVDSSNITRFDYDSRQCIIPTISFTNSSRCWVSNIRLELVDMEFSRFSRLKEFFKNLIPSKISLVIHFREAFFSFEDMAEKLFLSKGSSLRFSTILDRIFWTCRPTLIKLYTSSCSNIKFTKFLIKKLTVERNQVYYDSQGIESWERDLKEVKVEFYKENDKAEWKPGSWDCEMLREAPTSLSQFLEFSHIFLSILGLPSFLNFLEVSLTKNNNYK